MRAHEERKSQWPGAGWHLALWLGCWACGAHAAGWESGFEPTNPAQVQLTTGTARFTGKTDSQRAYLRSKAGGLAGSNFVAEVTVTVAPGGGVAMGFLGLGRGEADSNFYHEPALRPSLCLALAPSGFGEGLARVTADDTVRELARPGPGDGTHRVRLTWAAACQLARFELAPHWRGGKFTPAFSDEILGSHLKLDAESRLFLGGAGNVQFSDLQLRPATGEEIAELSSAQALADDPSAGTWLSGAGRAPSFVSPPDLAKSLHSIGAHLRPAVVWYQGGRIAASRPFVGDGARAALSFKGGDWECRSETRVLDGATDFFLHCRLASGTARQAGVAAVFDFPGWSTNNYVFIPAAAYAGNRFACLPVAYPPMFPDLTNALAPGAPARPITITDVPRLNPGAGPSKLEVLTSDTTTPGIGIYFPDRRRGVLIYTEDRTPHGLTGLTVEESLDRSQASVVFAAPGVREKRYGDMRLNPSLDRGVAWQAGDEVTLRLQVHEFEAADLQAFFRRFFATRRALAATNVPVQGTPLGEALRMQVALQNTPGLRWNETFGYYKNGNGDSPFGHIQLGWVGGLMQPYPLLFSRDELSRERSLRTLDYIFMKLPAESGLLHGIHRNGRNLDDAFGRAPDLAMVRKNADGLYYALKTFRLLEQMGQAAAVRPEWKEVVRRWADALCRLWERYGEFGQLVNVRTGDLHVSGSTAAAIAPAALTLAAQYFNEPRYLEVAKQAAKFYGQRDLLRGYTTGGPGEILQCPDSESAFALLESCVVLYEVTEDREYLRLAEDAAALCSSWVVARDFPFPPRSDLGRIGARSTGAVWASIQNKHAAPGACTTSADSLLKLYRATGNPAYLDLLRDIARALPEFMSTRQRPVYSRADGFLNERVNLSDWEGAGAVGGGHDSSVSWCEVALMLTAVEVPGIYIETDSGRLWVFDHVEAEIVSREGDQLRVRVHNPTTYPAKVRVLAESRGTARRPLGWHALLHSPVWELLPGEAKEYKVGREP
jgi:hypothetical protein